jgi:hypothetical protein
VAALLAPGTSARAAESICEAWLGEPAPLPTVASRDPALARWAELRVAELSVRAQLAEAGDAIESHRLWRRVLCLDPASPLAWRGLDRTRSLRIYRPLLEWGDPRQARAAPSDPWDGLAAPVQVARAPAPRTAAAARPVQGAPPQRAALAPARKPAAPPAPAPPEPARAPSAAHERARSLVAQGEESLRGARFEEALARAEAARAALAPEPNSSAAGALRARAEVLAATAQIALGDEAAARASFTRALAADPALALDPAHTSPKVLRALEAARAGRGGGG